MESSRTKKVYIFREGLKLYHITPIRSHDPDIVEGRPWMANVPIGQYTYNLDMGMFFGLAEILTMYRDSRTEDGWESAHLSTVSTKTLKLINYGKDKPMWNDKEHRRLKNLGIDGWIAYDDPKDAWREVYLFFPRGKIAPFMELDHDEYDRPMEYLWEHIDQKNLNNSCIGSYNIGDLIVPS